MGSKNSDLILIEFINGIRRLKRDLRNTLSDVFLLNMSITAFFTSTGTGSRVVQGGKQARVR